MREMTAEAWLENCLYDPHDANIIENCISVEDLPVSYKWANLLLYCVKTWQIAEMEHLNRAMKLDFPKGVLLYGASGNGRHTVQEGIASYLCGSGWYVLMLTGGNMAYYGEEAVMQALSGLFEREDIKICITLEDLNVCPFSGAVAGALEQAVSYSGYEGFPQIFLAALESPEKLSESLVKSLLPCRFSDPDSEERTEFLRMKLGELYLSLSDVSESELAELCAGFSYAKMEKLLYFLRLEQKQSIIQKVPINTWSELEADPSRLMSHSLKKEKVTALVEMLKEPEPAAPVVQTVAVAQAVPAVPSDPMNLMAGMSAAPAGIRPEEAEKREKEKLDAMSFHELNSYLDNYYQTIKAEQE